MIAQKFLLKNYPLISVVSIRLDKYRNYMLSLAKFYTLLAIEDPNKWSSKVLSKVS